MLLLKDHKNQHRYTQKPTNIDPHQNSPKLLTHTTTPSQRPRQREERNVRVKERFESGRRMRESQRVMRRKKDPCEGEKEKLKINNGVRVRLDLRTEIVSFIIFWTSLVFVQTLRVFSKINLFFFFFGFLLFYMAHIKTQKNLSDN